MENSCEYSKLTIPSDFAYADIAAEYVGQMAKKFGFSDRERGDVEAATREAVTNVIQHAFEPTEKTTFDVSCERVPLGLKIVVRDLGIPFAPEQVPQCVRDPETGEPEGPGCGIFAMRDLMDEVHYNNLGPGGKETVLVKYLHNRDVTDYFQACELGTFDTDGDVEAPAISSAEFTVRDMRPSDAVEVSRCIYRAYGYSYTNENIYYPERVAELNKNGWMHSAVAVTSDDEVVGHSALFMQGQTELIAEIGLGVVRPEFRSRGILSQMTEYLVEKAKSLGLMGLFGRPVTSHIYSQRSAHAFGFRDCGVLLGYIPQTSSFKGIVERLSQRETLLIHFNYLAQAPSVVIFPPLSHAEMIDKLYRNIGGVPETRTSYATPKELCPANSTLKTSVFGRMSFARIDIETCGEDMIPEVKTTLRDLRLKHIDIIHLYLDLTDPLTCNLVPQLEDSGFFFAGIVPGALPGDALVLQYLNNVPIDYSKIKVDSEVGTGLLNYIRGADPNRY